MVMGPYKQYQRGQRVQDAEETYGKGMMFTNNPLEEGFSKVMINWDFKDAGQNLVPRPALRTSSFTVPDTAPLYADSMFIAGSKECVEENGITYRQILIGNSISRQLQVVTVLPDSVTGFKDIPTQRSLMHTVLNAKYKVPTQAEIHGININNNNIARHVGTFGFNNSYYFFTDAGLQQTKFDTATNRYITEAVELRHVSPKEAVMWGYNMLETNPYTFVNVWGGASIPIGLEGLLPYDTNGKLLMSPGVNQSLVFECFGKGTVGKTYNIKWEYKDAASATWTTLKADVVTLAANTKLQCAWSAPDANVMIKLTAQNTLAGQEADMQVMIVGFNFKKDAQGSGLNAEQKIYDLRNCTVMTYWKNRLIFGLNNMLFLSDINNPGYLPYPNNVEPFDEQIIHVLPFLDNLLVFTNSKLYMLTLTMDGLSYTIRCIQSNLNVKDWDIHLIRVVKNMVFFKSGNYYYMVVPKAMSTTGELVIAPISNPIKNLFDSFQPNLTEILDKLYNYNDTSTLIHYYNYLDFEDIHNVYVFKTAEGLYLHVTLLYNTMARCWRMYIFEAQHFVVPAQQDATKKGLFMSLTPTSIGGNLLPCIQFLKFDNMNFIDYYIPKGLILSNTTPTLNTVFKNYQMLDTGYREKATDYKKRFREAQLKFNNVSQEQLNFFTEFIIDGDVRKSMYKYVPNHELDPMSPDYGLLTLDKIPVDPVILPGSTILGADASDTNCWTLDVSRFPETLLWKVRIPFSGKGYSVRMVLVSYNERNFELLNNIWVYRMLNSR